MSFKWNSWIINSNIYQDPVVGISSVMLFGTVCIRWKHVIGGFITFISKAFNNLFGLISEFLLLLCFHSHNDVPTEPHQNISMAALRGTYWDLIPNFTFYSPPEPLDNDMSEYPFISFGIIVCISTLVILNYWYFKVICVYTFQFMLF